MPGLEGDPEDVPARFSYTDDEMTINALRARVAELEAALAFYANPEVYKPDSIGRVMDLTFMAIKALNPINPQPSTR